MTQRIQRRLPLPSGETSIASHMLHLRLTATRSGKTVATSGELY
jgi:hypothetical protein